VFRIDNEPRVSISGKVINRKIQFTIHDNGIGMDSQVREKVFDMFVKGSEKSQGLGLGLYIVKKALSSLQGTIALAKTSFGETEFQFDLPCVGMIESRLQAVETSTNS
jgi:signal transduction histidine kinase